MFRKSPGYKAHYQNLTLFVAPDFDEWRILVQGPSVLINAGRQFTEAKAKEHAALVVTQYYRDERHEDSSPEPGIEWTAIQEGEWLNWRP